MASDNFSASELFSPYPAGRYKSDGPWSGESFRDVLVDLLRRHDVVALALDWPLEPGSSFLEEAFGGLVRIEGFTQDQLNKALQLEGALATEVRNYIAEAAADRGVSARV